MAYIYIYISVHVLLLLVQTPYWLEKGGSTVVELLCKHSKKPQSPSPPAIVLQVDLDVFCPFHDTLNPEPPMDQATSPRIVANNIKPARPAHLVRSWV